LHELVEFYVLLARPLPEKRAATGLGDVET
jgi:hypothetical protein